MNKVYKKYVNSVLRRIPCGPKVKKRIRYDLYSMLEDKSRELGEADPHVLLGKPEELAEDFIDNMEQDFSGRYSYASERACLGMPLMRMNLAGSPCRYRGEYKSERTLFGVPLIHINHRPFGVAKGIIAVGHLSIGLISIGLCSIGLLSFGVLSLGLLIGLGAFAFGGILAMGGVAIAGLFALGGCAISGYVAFGGYAAARELAIGGYARGNIAIGDTIRAHVGLYETKGIGDYVTQISDNGETMKQYIFDKAPDTSGIIKSIIENIISGLVKGTTHFR